MPPNKLLQLPVLHVVRSDCQQISAHTSERNASWMSARLSYRTRRRRNWLSHALRLGYAVASTKVVQEMRNFATEDGVNAIVAHVAGVALDDTEGVKDFVKRNTDDAAPAYLAPRWSRTPARARIGGPTVSTGVRPMS